MYSINFAVKEFDGEERKYSIGFKERGNAVKFLLDKGYIYVEPKDNYLKIAGDYSSHTTATIVEKTD